MYSRIRPSPHYWELIWLYRKEHKNLKRFRGNRMIFNHIGLLEILIRETGARTILDYGCGKGNHIQTKVKKEEREPILAEIWKEKLGVDLHGYDPACSRFNKLPKGPFDGVISFDTLEHIAEEDLPWVIEEMFSLAQFLVVARVACFSSSKRFAGTKINMHATIQPPKWWLALFEEIGAKFPGVRWRLFTETVEFDASQSDTAQFGADLEKFPCD